MAARAIDPIRSGQAFSASAVALRGWLAALPGAAWGRPSVLAGQTVADLAAHLPAVPRSAARRQPAPRGTRPLSVSDYLAPHGAVARRAAAEPARSAREVPERSPAGVLQALDHAQQAAQDRLAAFGSGDPVVDGCRGPIRWGDYLATRLIELVVQADDLARSAPDVEPPELPRDAVRLCVRTLLDTLAARFPGRSVEVRIPPHAAVQCIEGPKHTRGTPPNVVETDAVTWLRLAAGRISWSDAVTSGAVSASGERSDLTAYLPLL